MEDEFDKVTLFLPESDSGALLAENTKKEEHKMPVEEACESY